MSTVIYENLIKYLPKISQLVCHNTCDDWNDDIHNTEDEVGDSYLIWSKPQRDHVDVDEGVDEGETGRLEEKQQLDTEQ